MVRTKNTQRCILCLKTCSCSYCLGESFFKIIWAISRQCFVYGCKLDHGVHPAAINGDVVPSFTTIYWFIIVQAARLVHKCNNEPCIDIMISRTQNNHPKGHLWWETKMIVWLVATWHIRRSRRNQGWAWLFVMNQNRTSCSWSEWFDLRIEKLKNVDSPIMQ